MDRKVRVDYKDIEFEKGKHGTRVAGKGLKKFAEILDKGKEIVVENGPLYRGTTQRIMERIGYYNRIYVKMPDYWEHQRLVFGLHKKETVYPKGNCKIKL